MKIKNIAVVYAQPTDGEEKSALDLVKRVLKKHKINYIISKREELNKRLFQNKDLVIAVGGVGTFLRTAHFIFDKTLALGVNSNPRYKGGFFMVTTKKDFEKKFKKVLKGDYNIKKFR
jgi:NAD kinase